MVAKGTMTDSCINWKKEKLVTCKHGNKCECVTLSESLDIDHRSLKTLIKALIKLTLRS